MSGIAHLTSVHDFDDPRIYHKECKSLARAGHDVTLVVPREGDEVTGGIRIKGVGRKPSSRLARVTRAVWRIYWAASRLDAKVYHFHDPELIPVGLLLRARGKLVVYDIHEDLPRDVLTKHYLPLWVRRLLARLTERLEAEACRRYSALVPATPAIAERFTEINPNTVVVQNFPAPEELAPPPDRPWSERCQAVAYVGSITENRGAREMVQAIGLLPDCLSATLRLAGPFDPQSLHDEVKCLDGWKRVQELGVVDHSKVAHLLGQVRAGLVVLHPDEPFQVAYPVKLFEYMAAGIPVVASDFPLWRRIVQDAGCGLLTDPLNPRAIADAMEFLLTHPEQAEAMGQRGREAVERRYNWRSEEQKLLGLYTRLLSPLCAG